MNLDDLYSMLLDIQVQLGDDERADEVNKVLHQLAENKLEPKQKLINVREILAKITRPPIQTIKLRSEIGTVGLLYEKLEPNTSVARALIEEMQTKTTQQPWPFTSRADINHLDRKKLNEFFQNILAAEEKQDNDALFYQLYSIKRYLETKYANLSDERKRDLRTAYNQILNDFLDEFKKTNLYVEIHSELNAKLSRLFTIEISDQEYVYRYKPLRDDMSNDDYQKEVDTHVMRYMTHRLPIKDVIPAVERLFPNEIQESFKKKLQEYQIEHAYAIRDAQVKLKEGKEERTLNVTFNGMTRKQNLQNDASYEFLMHVEKMLLSDKWMNPITGKKIYDENKKHIATLSPNQYRMYQEIQEAKRLYKASRYQAVENSFQQVIQIGQAAALKTPKSFLGFGKRKEKVQNFFNLFKVADSNNPANPEKQKEPTNTVQFRKK